MMTETDGGDDEVEYVDSDGDSDGGGDADEEGEEGDDGGLAMKLSHHGGFTLT